MTTLIEVSDLHELVGGNGQARQEGADLNLDDEGLGRSYVCSMSSAVDLEGQSSTDLAQNVQRYLSRIVEELHLISAWSSSICQQQQHVVTSPVASESGSDRSFTAMARLAVVTDIELMRRDMTKAQHELSQRCTTQLAYVQNDARVAVSKQDTLYNEIKQRVDDQQRSRDQFAQSIQALEKGRTGSAAQVRDLAATLRQVQQQSAAHPATLSALEKSIITMTAAQFSHEQEVQALYRRVESNEIAHQLQLEATRRATDESLAGLRSANSQLASKMQVLRVELQELNESTQKRMQQFLHSIDGIVSANSPTLNVNSVAPRRPSVSSSRAPRSGGIAPSQSAKPGISSDKPDSIFDGAMTEAGAVMTTDCFMYAKAALPHRSSTPDSTASTKKSIVSSSSSRASVSSSEGSSTRTGRTDSQSQDAMTNLLKVQQSVLSVPLGYENDAATIEAPNDNMSSADRPDPLIPTRRGTHRHKSLPVQRTPSPRPHSKRQ